MTCFNQIIDSHRCIKSSERELFDSFIWETTLCTYCISTHILMQKWNLSHNQEKKNSVGENPCKSPLHWLLDHFRCVVLNLVVKLNLKTWCDAETLCLEEYSCKHWGTWHLFSIVICRGVNASRKMQKGLILFILIFIIFI